MDFNLSFYLISKAKNCKNCQCISQEYNEFIFGKFKLTKCYIVYA